MKLMIVVALAPCFSKISVSKYFLLWTFLLYFIPIVSAYITYLKLIIFVCPLTEMEEAEKYSMVD